MVAVSDNYIIMREGAFESVGVITNKMGSTGGECYNIGEDETTAKFRTGKQGHEKVGETKGQAGVNRGTPRQPNTSKGGA